MILHNLKVQFSHNMVHGVTSCVCVGDQNAILDIGVRARCSKKDQYCRETGRKVTLARLLKVLNFPKEERSLVWEAYRVSPIQKGGKPKWYIKEKENQSNEPIR
jgi:hypothetical protein